MYKLSDLCECFREERFNGVQLAQLTDEDLRARNVTDPRIRDYILQGITALRKQVTINGLGFHFVFISLVEMSSREFLLSRCVKSLRWENEEASEKG